MKSNSVALSVPQKKRAVNALEGRFVTAIFDTLYIHDRIEESYPRLVNATLHFCSGHHSRFVRIHFTESFCGCVNALGATNFASTNSGLIRTAT